MANRTIYKAVNHDLRQILIGCSGVPIDQLKNEHRKTRPAVIAHWDLDRHKIEYIGAGVELGEHSYQDFLRQYSMSTGIPGWRTLIEE